MYYKIETWLNDVLEHKVPPQIPSEIRAFCFNLYEGGNGDWSMELVGTESFDPDDEDWACDEITDFGTREEPLSWKKEADWNEVLSEVSSALKHYLENGSHADVLKSRFGVAVGFTDGNLEILYSDLSGMAQAGIPDKTVMKEKMQRMEPAKKAADIRTVMMFLAALVFTVGLIACLYFLYLHNRDTAADRQDLGGATQENNVGQAGGENEELYVPATAMPDAASDSYLYGMYPSELWAGDDRMEEAARISLQHRLKNGGGYTGWSCAWIINLMAVLGDGEGAWEYLHTLLTRSTYPNLWDAHEPFQIDGNFGGIAGIVNMLVQDRGGKLKLLPALPKQFSEGYVRGLRIKGNKEVSLCWKDGKVTESKISDIFSCQ